MIDENNTAEKVAEAEAAVEQAQPVALNIQDLANIRKILDIASQRGAFKTEEFQVVGAVYGKLNTFVNAAIAAAEQQKAEAEVAEVPAEATAEE